ncbi:MAG: SAM-dependent methyltransferase [Pseudomonadota bacterium]
MPESDRAPPRRLFIATPGFESALAAELSATPFPGPPHVGLAGIVETAEPPPGTGAADPVFARQQLPAAALIQASSIAALAEAAYARIEGAVDRAGGPFTLHAFVPTGEGPALGSRAALVAEETLNRLRERRRRAARSYRPAGEAATAFGDIRVLIQILMVDRDRAWVSAAAPRALSAGGWDLAPWPGGTAPVADDRRPPSRAYRKLEEAFLWMADEPAAGATCVDLGGAPGGWSYTALRRGARVTAVDRAPLEPPVLGHPRLRMIEGNAFTHEPAPGEAPVDWLLSDIICEPARALALCDRWVSRGWCRRLVATVKFKGQSDYGMLAEVRETLRRAACPRLRIKHLHHNKNEVTVMAATSLADREQEKPPRPRI